MVPLITRHEQYDNIYVPELLFCNAKTGTNFDDTKERRIGGWNGLGAKLTNILSTMFKIDIVNNHQHYSQLITNGNTNINPPVITATKQSNFTWITYEIDWKYFKINDCVYSDDLLAQMRFRVYEVAQYAAQYNVILKLNNKTIKTNFKQFC
jgi:DNA topoisomerase-2